MNPALARQPGVLRFNLSLPSARVRLGPVSLDGVELLLGVSLSQILDPLMPAPRFSRAGPSGSELDVYPLAIPTRSGGRRGAHGPRETRGGDRIPELQRISHPYYPLNTE